MRYEILSTRGGVMISDEEAMSIAIRVSRQSDLSVNDVPVGAAIFDNQGNLISVGFNQRELNQDSTAHAEIVAIQLACKSLETWRLDKYKLFVTLEPCLMCAGAILQSRLSKVIFGAWDKKAGACGSEWDVLRDRRRNQKMEVKGGVLEQECSQLLKDFFLRLR